MITLKVAGFVELEKALRRLPEMIAGPVLTAALRKAGAPMAATASRLAPRSGTPGPQGHMADSIKLRSMKNGEETARAEGLNDFEVNLALGPDRRHFYGSFSEFGTVHQSARPFMRPAWDQHKDEVLAILGKELWAGIDRAARRLAKQS